MQQLIDALTARLDPASVRLFTQVNVLAKASGGWVVGARASAEFYGTAILATPAWVAAGLLCRVDPALAADLGGIPYSSSITVNLIYDEDQLGSLPDGFGLDRK